MGTDAPFRAVEGGILLAVRLTPRSSADRVDGLKADSAGAVHIAARVRAVPDKGAANEALVRLVAGWLAVPSGSVSIRAGHSARLKTVMIAGDPGALGGVVAARLR